jgi:hypothetical protein
MMNKEILTLNNEVITKLNIPEQVKSGITNNHVNTVELSCTKRGNVSKFPKPGRYETSPQKMETSGETPYIKKLKNIYMYI